MEVEAGAFPGWIGLVSAVIVFGAGLWQYRAAQAWKRAEFLAIEAKVFFDDPKIATALLLIDYSVIRLNDQGVPSRTGTVFDDDTVARSLALHTEFVDETEHFSTPELQARVAFDALFTG